MDPIGDMLNRIKNAQAVGHESMKVSYSNAKFELAKIMEKNGFIKMVDKGGRGAKKYIELNLNYDENGRPKVSGLKRISRPGRRVYIKTVEIKPVKQGFGKVIISTPAGLLVGEDARKRKVGGEVICEIW